MNDEINEIKDELKETKEKVEEYELKPLRDEIVNRRDSVSDCMVGIALGSMVGVYGGGIISIVTGFPFPPLIIGGIAGVTRLNHNNTVQKQRALFESYERSYLEENPQASKKEAFDYAKGNFEEAMRVRRKHQDECMEELADSWNGP